MNIFKELVEIEETQDKLKDMKDSVLDLYETNPEKSKKLLIEMNDLENELNELEVKFNNLINDEV